MNRCPKCGNEMANNQQTCLNCGTVLAISDIRKREEKNFAKTFFIPLISSFMICFVIMIFTFVSTNKSISTIFNSLSDSFSEIFTGDYDDYDEDEFDELDDFEEDDIEYEDAEQIKLDYNRIENNSINNKNE